MRKSLDEDSDRQLFLFMQLVIKVSKGEISTLRRRDNTSAWQAKYAPSFSAGLPGKCWNMVSIFIINPLEVTDLIIELVALELEIKQCCHTPDKLCVFLAV